MDFGRSRYFRLGENDITQLLMADNSEGEDDTPILDDEDVDFLEEDVRRNVAEQEEG